MRRMYSEQELTNVIKKVFEEELESGALDELVSDAVDAYLVEHPVDITALEGQDVELNSLDATGLITGGEIVEKMSGYSLTNQDEDASFEIENIYASACKNGNKITFVGALNFTRLDTIGADAINYGRFNIPHSVYEKLYPTLIGGGGYLSLQKIRAWADESTSVELTGYFVKGAGDYIYFIIRDVNTLTANTKYYIRFESTFLLSDNLISEE